MEPDINLDDVDYELSRKEFEELLGGRHINNLKLTDAMTMAKMMDVKGFKQATTLAQVQMCLKLHLLKVNKMEKRGHEPLKVFKRLKKHYQKSCEKLTEIFEECIQQLAKVADDDPLIGDLEKSIPGFKFPDTLREHVEKLLNPECKILVTGELCAGKTSVVNTLLEEKVLPANFLSNTLTLCELKYGEWRGARVHPWKPEEPLIYVTDNDDFLRDLAKRNELDYVPEWFDQGLSSEGSSEAKAAVGGQTPSDDSISDKFEIVLPKETGPRPFIDKVEADKFLQTTAKYIEEKDTRDKSNNKRGRYKTVEVFLPNELLKDGLTIIDSPGIGDSPRLTDIVIENLVSAFGFIYVINSNARGGVQEDRLQALLKKVRTLESIDNQKLFSQESAIFVCNQWDKIPVTEHERLLADTEKKLAKCWSGLQPDQIIPFSAKEAGEIYDEGYMTLEYKNLLDGIEDLIPVGLENKIFMSFKYLAALLQRLLRQLDGYLNHLQSSEEDRKKQFSELHKRLKYLKNLSKKQFKELKKDVDAKLKDVHLQLQKHLLEENTMKSLCQWSMEEAPGKVYNFDEVYMHIQKKMTERITMEIQRWEEDHQFFEKVPDAISDKFRGFFGQVEKEMEEIQDKITNVKIEVKNTEAWKKRDKLDLSPLLMYEKFHKAVKNPAKAVAASFLLPIVVPIAVVAAIPALVAFGAMAAKTMLTDNQKQNYLSEYSNPKTCQACLRQHSGKFLQFYCKSTEHLYSQLQEMMKPAYDIVDDLQKFIPQLIESDNQQVISLMNDKRQAGEVLKFYPGYRALMSEFRKRLHHFQVHHMKRNSRDIIVHNFIDTKVIDDQAICSGWFTTLHRAQLTTRKGRRSLTHSISLRCIKRKVHEKDIGDYLVEEECWSLKPEREKNIAKFIGLTVEDTEIIYHILEPMTGNLRSRMRSGSLGGNPQTDEAKKTLINNVACQIAQGLEYLHSKHIVHFDLTLDTVAYKMEGNTMVVKLTNMSIPKQVPVDPEMTKEELMQYRYLPWDVLNGGVYTKESDMYSFGLMLWEMVTTQEAFAAEFDDRPINSLESLMNCIEYGRPRVNFSLSVVDAPTSEFDQTWESLMCSLWDNKPSERLTAQKFLRNLNDPSTPKVLPIFADHFSA